MQDAFAELVAEAKRARSEESRLRARVAADEQFIYDRAFEFGAYLREQGAGPRVDGVPQIRSVVGDV